jgi:tRNA(adenine34) deaminase
MSSTDTRTTDERLMRRCFALAKKSARQGEYPYGAIVVRDGEILAETTNRVAHDRDVTRHAEVVAICMAQRAIGSTNLDDCTLYANVEPCAFCSYAIRESRIARVVFATPSPIMGGASRWDILGDRKLSDLMPEVFAPPPAVVPEFLFEEGDAVLRRSSPVAWAFMRARGLLESPSRPSSKSMRREAGIVNHANGIAAAANWIMRILRVNFFDRFGRGGRSRRPRRSVTSTRVRPSPSQRQ